MGLCSTQWVYQTYCLRLGIEISYRNHTKQGPLME